MFLTYTLKKKLPLSSGLEAMSVSRMSFIVQIKYIVFVVLNFFVVFGFNVQGRILFFNDTGNLSLFFMVLLIIAIFIKDKKIDLSFITRSGLFRFEFAVMLLLFSAVMVLSLFFSVAHGTYTLDYLMVNLPFYVSVVKTLLIPLLFFCAFMKEYATFRNYVIALLYAAVLLFISSVILNLSVPLKDWWINGIVLNRYIRMGWGPVPSEHFRVAITGTTGDSTSAITGLYFLLGCYIFSNEKYHLKKWYYTIILFLCAVATIFYARIGMFAIVGGFLILMWNRVQIRKFIFLAFITAFSVILLRTAFPLIQEILNFMFEIFISLNRTGQVVQPNTSIETILSWFRMPPLEIFLIGEGSFAYTDYIGDSGVMRGIYYFGIFGLLFQYACMYGIYRAARKPFADNNDKNGVLLCRILLVLFFIWEFKLPSFSRYAEFFLLVYWLSHTQGYIYRKYRSVLLASNIYRIFNVNTSPRLVHDEK